MGVHGQDKRHNVSMLRAEVLETRLYFVIINMPLLRAHYVLDAVLSTEGTYCCF